MQMKFRRAICYILMAFKLSFIVRHSCQQPHHYHYQQTFSAHPLCTQHCGIHKGERAQFPALVIVEEQ